MRKILALFMSGLVTVLPLALTIYVIWWLVHTVEGWLRRALIALGIVSPEHYWPGLGLIVGFVLLATRDFINKIDKSTRASLAELGAHVVHLVPPDAEPADRADGPDGSQTVVDVDGVYLGWLAGAALRCYPPTRRAARGAEMLDTLLRGRNKS